MYDGASGRDYCLFAILGQAIPESNRLLVYLRGPLLDCGYPDGRSIALHSVTL